MELSELILEAENRAWSARVAYVSGNPEAAKDALTVLAGKIVGELPCPAKLPPPWPGHGQP